MQSQQTKDSRKEYQKEYHADLTKKLDIKGKCIISITTKKETKTAYKAYRLRVPRGDCPLQTLLDTANKQPTDKEK